MTNHVKFARAKEKMRHAVHLLANLENDMGESQTGMAVGYCRMKMDRVIVDLEYIQQAFEVEANRPQAMP